jgi:hypothetical protein
MLGQCGAGWVDGVFRYNKGLMDIASSVNRVPIRLTDERWSHIVNNHDEMAGYYDDCLAVVENPDLVLAGTGGSLHAVKAYGRRRYLVVVYRELSAADGFVITAYFVRKINRRRVQWQR